MYTLYAQGPDNLSTYGECWGAGARSWGRYVATSSTLTGLAEAVEHLGHDNFVIVRGKTVVAGSRKEYYARPAVQAAHQ